MNYQISDSAAGADLDLSNPLVGRFLSLPGELYTSGNLTGRAFLNRACEPKAREATAAEIRRFAVNTARCFIVERDGATVARLVARLDLTEPAAPLGQLGYFESKNESAAAALLFETAIGWLRAAGATRIIGPIDGDTWHRYRLNVGPFEDPIFFLEPVNPPFYQRLWEEFGFRAIEEYYTARVDDLAIVQDSYAAAAEELTENGYSTRPVDLDRFEDELDLLYDLTIEIFSGNFLYTPIERQEFKRMYLGLRRYLTCEDLTFAYAPDGQPVGFLFGIPDLLEGASPETMNLKTLGIKRDHRRAGLAKGLFGAAYQSAYRRGFRAANLCLIRQGNPSGRLDAGQGRIIRSYRLYEFAG